MMKFIRRIWSVVVWTAGLWLILQVVNGITDMRKEIAPFLEEESVFTEVKEVIGTVPINKVADDELIKLSQEGNEVLKEDIGYKQHLQYAKQFLTPSAQLTYNDLLKNIIDHNTEPFEVTTVSKDEFIQAYSALMNDVPEIFYVKSFVYYIDERDSIQSAKIIYNVTKKQRQQKEKEIEQVVEDLLGKVNDNWSDYEKVKYLYDTIIQNTTYDLRAPDNQNIYSVLVGRRSVCAGYARTLQYLMHQLDMVSIYVTGYALNTEEGNIGHAWNLVKMDDAYYYVDATWGDPMFRLKNANKDFIGYAYFGISSEELALTHVLDMDYPLPIAEGTSNNYYIKEKLLVDRKSVKAFILEALIHGNAQGQMYYSIKCADDYETIINEIFRNGYINKLIKEANQSVDRPYADVLAIYPSPDANVIDFTVHFSDEKQ